MCADWFAPFGSRRRSSVQWQSPDLGDMWRHGCPIGPEQIKSCSASENSLGCKVYEHNSECQAIEVIGQDCSSGVVALSCHMAMDLLCHEMRDVCWDSSESLGSPRSLCSQCRIGCLESQLSQQTKAFLSPWTGCANETDVVRENKRKRGSVSDRSKFSNEDLNVSLQRAPRASF